MRWITSNKLRCGLALILALAWFRPGAAADWPQWRGPDRSGVSTEAGLLSSWPDGGPELLWTTFVGPGFASVAVADGRLFTIGTREGREYVVALDAGSGEELWALRTGKGYENDRGDGPRGTPTVVGDTLYVLSPSAEIWALDVTNGQPRWSVDLVERFGGNLIRWGLSESPLVIDDRVIVQVGADGGSIAALDRSNGDLIWRSEGLTDGPSYASAIAHEVGGISQIFHVTDRAAVGLAADDGRLLWRYERAMNETANCTTPVYVDGHVYVTSGYDTGAALLRLTASDDGIAAEEVYFTRHMINHHGGVVLYDGHIYGFSNKTLVCMDVWTGEVRWRAHSVGKGSLIAADGMLYVLGEKGIAGLVQATPEAYREVSRFDTGARHRAWAHPVISDGRLYLRIGSMLRCYDVGAD